MGPFPKRSLLVMIATLFRNRALVMGVLAGVSFSAAASAVTLTVIGTYPVGLTDFSGTLSVAKFDPDLGNLVSVQYSLTGTAQGGAGLENMGPTARTANASVGATLIVKRPDLTTLASIPLLSTFSVTLSAYDGLPDFSGTSGAYVPFSSSGTVSGLLTSPGDLALFTSGSPVDLLLDLPVGATGVSSIQGGGNFLAAVDTKAGAVIEVTYTYNQLTVPEAGTYLAALGLTGLAGAVVRRRRAAR